MSLYPADADRLDSWKAIATYLDRQVRTVQRWEKEEGLPIHRVPHKKQGSVYAFKSELDAWRQRSPGLVGAPEPPAPAEPTRSRLPWGGGIAALVVLGAIIAWWRAQPAPAPPAPVAWGRLLAKATRQGGAPRWVAVGPSPRVVALSPDGRTLYVGDEQDGSLRLVDTATLRVRAVLRLGGAISRLVAAGDGRRLYVGQLTESRLDIVDTSRQTWRSLATSGAVSDMALSPDGDSLYLALQYAGMDVIHTTSLVAQHVIGPACPSMLAFSADGRHLYIYYQCGGGGGRSGHDAVGIWDVNQRQLVGRLAGPPQVGTALAVVPDGSELWAGMGDACSAPGYDHVGCLAGQVGGLNIYSLGEQKLLHTVPLPSSPIDIEFLPGGARVVVSGAGIGVLDSTRMNTVENLTLPISRGLALAADGSRAYLPQPAAHAVAVYDASPAACAPSNTGLLGWWRGDGTAADAWGLNNGRWLEAAAYAPGRVGQALAFTGGNALLLGHDSTLLSGQSLAFAAWLEPQSEGGGAAIVAKYDPATGRGWQLRSLPQGRLSFCTGAGRPGPCGGTAATHVEAAAALSAGQWTHIAVTAAHGRAEIYLNGRAAATGAVDLRFMEDVQADLVLGGAGWRGLLDEAVYYTHLDAATLRALVAMPACMLR